MNEIPVLDKGYVRLVDHMGDDLTIVNAARVSFGKNSGSFIGKDGKLLQYLIEHKHTSPFYHPQLQFQIKAPISVQRQFFKHKVGTAENSESTRYIEVKEEFYIPDKFRLQSSNNKQGSDGYCNPETQPFLQTMYINTLEECYDTYKELIDCGVAKEQAREVLPLCTYTSWVWSASLQAVLHFIKLRTEEHAQEEIRQYAKAMQELTEPLFLETFKILRAIGELQ